ncbi:MAG: HYR domain-containing protein [Nitrosarchaeum sp.]|nr:HYR domain-containing protein [Nitrosarchaeum sp.]
MTLVSLIFINTAFAESGSNQIPSWIKKNAGWWSDGSIDDNSFTQGIQYLIKEKIIKVQSTIQEDKPSSNEIPSWIKKNAKWWSDGQIDDDSFVTGIEFLIKTGLIQLPITNENVEQKINSNSPDFTILLKPDSMVLPSGGYGEVDITVKSLNGWDERIWLNIPIPIGPIKYPTIVPKLVTPTSNSDATAAFAVDVEEFSCPGQYKMAVYGMRNTDKIPMTTHYTYFNLEILPPGKIFELSSDQQVITIPKGSSKSFDLEIKNLDKHDWGFLVDPVDNFRAPTGVKIEHTQAAILVKNGESNKATINIKTSEDIRTPMTFTLPMQALTALNCDPAWMEKTNIVVNIIGQEDSSDSDQILIPESGYTKPTNTKPQLTIPKQVTQEATSSSGAVVNYDVSGKDTEDGTVIPSCDHPSDSIFPIGSTTVKCTANDSDSNSISGTFTVTVRDTTPPNIAAFQPTEGSRDETGVVVFFEVTANDLVDGNVPTSCNYPSGTKFPIGVTVLTCTADDSRGNHASRSLQLTVTVTESGQ